MHYDAFYSWDDAAVALLRQLGFQHRFRFDATARTWRELPSGRPAPPERVIAEAFKALEYGLTPSYVDTYDPPKGSRDYYGGTCGRRAVPLVAWQFRCVDATPLTAEVLKPVEGSWPEFFARVAYRLDIEAYKKQLLRVRRTLSYNRVRQVVYLASGMDTFAYEPPADVPVEADPRGWLRSLPRDPGALLLTSSLYREYCRQLPDGTRPLPRRQFFALATEILGERVLRTGRHYFVGVRLTPPPIEKPGDDQLCVSVSSAGLRSRQAPVAPVKCARRHAVRVCGFGGRRFTTSVSSDTSWRSSQAFAPPLGSVRGCRLRPRSSHPRRAHGSAQ